MGKIKDETVEWIRPVIVTIIGLLFYEFLIVGALKGIPLSFNSVKVNSKYKVVCNFEIKNAGFRTVDKKKIQLNIPKNAKIENIDIHQKYKYLYKVSEGGDNQDYVILSIEGLEGRESIKGSVIFHHNTKWDENINPITFSK